MGLLDWFKNRPSQFDPEARSEHLTRMAIDKAVTLVDPRLKALRGYQERLAPAVETTLAYLRQQILAVPPPIQVSLAMWSRNAALRAFFVAPDDISLSIGRSPNLRKLFEKYPQLDDAYFIMDMTYIEQRAKGLTLRGDVTADEIMQTVIGFGGHQARICGLNELEVRRLVGIQGFEYLVAQALSEIAEDRTERRELEEKRGVIRARLRLLRQQGPGLGSVFAAAPANLPEQQRLEAELLENERQLAAAGDFQGALDNELDCLCAIMEHPDSYLHVDARQLRLSSLNVLVDESSGDVASDISFSLARLSGTPRVERAFVMARYSRIDLATVRLDLGEAERYL